MKQYNVAVVTGSRADYGIMRRYLALLNADPSVNLEVLATGALLDNAFGRPVDLIVEDGFQIRGEVPIHLPCAGIEDMAQGLAQGFTGFAPILVRNGYDLIIVLGDRYEILPPVFLAASLRIPVLHIHGGEATFANYDEFIRHSITKMARYHFAATEEYRRRIIQLGESPEYVFNLGSLGAENCVKDAEINAELPFDKGTYFVVLFHPETISGANPLDQVNELLASLDAIEGVSYVFIGSNADTHADIVRSRIYEYAENQSNAEYIENLKPEVYHALVRDSLGLIGNSSSGLIEAPSLKVPTVNIGNRQAGRVRGPSVLDVECKRSAIISAINSILEGTAALEYSNPYYCENSAEAYYETTLSILANVDKVKESPKAFYDLSFSEES